MRILLVGLLVVFAGCVGAFDGDGSSGDPADDARPSTAEAPDNASDPSMDRGDKGDGDAGFPDEHPPPPPATDPRRPSPNDTVTAHANVTTPGLYEAMPGPGELGGITVNHTSAREGIPFNGTLEDTERDRVSLIQVTWTPAPVGPTPQQPQFWLEPTHDGDALQIRAVTNGTGGEDHLRALFLAFARNVTAADNAQLDRWAATFELSGQDERPPSNVRVVEVGGPMRTAAFLDELRAQGEPTVEAWVGGRTLSAANWTYRFTLDMAGAEWSGESERARLTVDASDRGSFFWSGPFRTSDEAPQERLAWFFETLKLGEPPNATFVGPGNRTTASNGTTEDGPRSTVAQWRDPGTFERMPPDGNVSGEFFSPLHVRHVVPPTRWQLNASPWADDEGPLFLGELVWHAPATRPVSQTGREFFTLQGDGRLTAVLEERYGPQDVRGLFTELIWNVSAADGDTKEAWADAFVASGEELGSVRMDWTQNGTYTFYHYEVTVDGNLTLDALVREIARDEGLEASSDAVTVELENRYWRFSLLTPHATATWDGQTKQVHLVVAADGDVALVVDHAAGEAEMWKTAEMLYKDLGLGEPSFGGWQVAAFHPN